jgi:hypothetical protein
VNSKLLRLLVDSMEVNHPQAKWEEELEEEEDRCQDSRPWLEEVESDY